MSTEQDKKPETLIEAIRYFSEGDNAHNFIVGMRWPNGVRCPRCGSADIRPIATRKTWECKCCTKQKQFSVRVGTIFEDSPLPMHKWLAAMWLIANCKNGVSSYEIHRSIGVTQKTGWFMLQRLRLAMQTGTFEKLKGEVEIDETFIGGRADTMKKDRRDRVFKYKDGSPRGSFGKAIVVGMIERGGNVRAVHVPHRRRSQLQNNIEKHVEQGAQVYTDSLRSYDRLGEKYVHAMIDHMVSYVEGQVHTNTIENFWSLLKRTLRGTYVSVDPVHLFRYLDEQVFRFNSRKDNDAGRFALLANSVFGKRLTYASLIYKDEAC